MLKELFDQGKCLVGLHQGDFRFDAPTSCTQTRVCTVCGTRETRVAHNWSDYRHTSESSCEQVRQCKRCEEQESQVDHTWADWAYAGEVDCRQIRTCSRCRSVADDTQIVHRWQPWSYSEEHRAPIRACRRCPVRESRFPRQHVAPKAAKRRRAAAPAPSPATPAPRPAPTPAVELGESAPETPDSRAFEYANVFLDDDAAAVRRTLADEWLTVQLQGSDRGLIEDAFITGALESRLSAACVLGEPYARGVDPPLGVSIGQAVCMVSEKAFQRTQSPNYLFTLASAARVCLIGYQSLGRHTDVVKTGRSAAAWLEERGYLDAQANLLLYSVEGHLQLEQLEEAEQVLIAAERLTIPDAQSGERKRRTDLRRKLDAMAHRSATELAPGSTDPEAAFRTNYAELQDMVSGLRDMNKQMFGESSPFNDIVNTLTADVQDGAPSQAEWLSKNQTARDALTEFLSGGSGGMTELRNRNRIVNAAQIFSDPVKGRDRTAIEASCAVLLEAREWARTHDSPDDESDALWTLYLCYSRTDREPQAIEMLQALRSNLEARRRQIADPMERAGVFVRYPYLFASLCRLLCSAGRGPELFDAIEGSKGRLLSDALTAHRREAVPDADFVRPIAQLTTHLWATRAHYLSYFVDDEETYAVFVAKDGSTHCRTIALGKPLLRELAASVDPNRWQKPRAGYFGKATTVPETLSPLVDWLAPLVDAGVVAEADHLCYCPDEHLHLVPLHYVRFRGAPLVQLLSVSRIHSAAAMTTLLGRAASRPSQFVAAQVPAEQDLGDTGKVATLRRAAAWLAEHSSGTTLAREHATIDALAQLDLTERVVHFATHGIFPKDDIEGRSPNPFTSSGLALAHGGSLPSLLALTGGQSTDGLLTPERVLALNVSGSHVTLQACVTGLAKEGIGGDALGLDLAFLLAGAQSLLTTHWDVSAHASADFSLRFYEKWLVEGCSRADAWRSALLHLMEAPAPEGQPGEYYWAAFSLSGDWR